MLAVVLTLEQYTVVEDLVIEPGSNALVVNRLPNTLLGHVVGSEQVG